MRLCFWMTDPADLTRIESLPKTAWQKSDARHEQGWVDQHLSAYLVSIVALGGAQAVLTHIQGDGMSISSQFSTSSSSTFGHQAA
jgi:hypothetical protein